MRDSLKHRLNHYLVDELISKFEFEFARFLYQIDEEASDDSILICLICLHAQLKANVCIFLDEIYQKRTAPELEAEVLKSSNSLDSIINELHKAKFVGNPGEIKPMILEGNRLYLQKYWKYETELSLWIRNKSSISKFELSESVKLYVEALFKGSEPSNLIDWQKIAVYASLIKDFLIISGGPGTGKTFTVKNVIETLKYQKKSEEKKELRIGLAAPTGKAAQRLTNSLNDEDLKAVTLHKLLGSRGSSGQFIYGKKNKLPYDLVIVDEASMLDISLWVQLIRALSDDSKLIVLGDKDQLASVESGSVLGDLCFESEQSFSKDFVSYLNRETNQSLEITSSKSKINDAVILLTKSYRFDEQSGLGLLSKAINTENVELVFDIFVDKNYPEVKLLDPNSTSISDLIDSFIIEPYKSFKSQNDKEQFESFNRFRILCALRKGMYGVEGINEQAEKRLKSKFNIPQTEKWYNGRPILISKNNSTLKIKNGETGICRIEDESSKIIIEGESSRTISTTRLQDFEAGFAITVHKSQGSEFENVALILPEAVNPLLTKELLYTAVTRAQKSVLVIGTIDVLSNTISQKIKRSSGLSEKLLK